MNMIKRVVLPLLILGSALGNINVDSLTTKLIIESESNDTLYQAVSAIKLEPRHKQSGSFEIIKELHSRGYEMDFSYITPMHMAALLNDTLLAESWIDSVGVDPNVEYHYSPLALSMLSGSAEMTSWLIRNSADIHRSSTGEETFRKVIETGAFLNNPKTAAVFDTVLHYLDNPARVLNDNTTYLHLAALTDDSRLAEMALEAGVPVDFRDNHGFTPLLTASYQPNQKVIKLLLKSGADRSLNIEYGTNLVVAALHSGNLKLLKKCLRAGQRVNSLQPYALLDKENIDETMLHYCLKNREKLGLIPIKYPAFETIASLTEKSGDFTLLNEFYPAGAVVDSNITNLLAKKSEKVLSYLARTIPESRRLWKNDWLMLAAAVGNMPNLIDSLTLQGISLDTVVEYDENSISNKTALLIALENRYGDLALKLLEQGADLQLTQSLTKSSLLKLAIGCRNSELLDSLQQHGYSLEFYNESDTLPFYTAITNGDSSIYSYVKKAFTFNREDSVQQKILENYLVQFFPYPRFAWSYDSLLTLGVDPLTPHFGEKSLFDRLIELNRWELLDDLEERGYPLDSIYTHDELLLLASKQKNPTLISELLSTDRVIADSTKSILVRTWYVHDEIGDTLWEMFHGESLQWNYDSLFITALNYEKYDVALFALEKGASFPEKGYMYGGSERMNSLVEYGDEKLIAAVWEKMKGINNIYMDDLVKALFQYGSPAFVQKLIEKEEILFEKRGMWYIKAQAQRSGKSYQTRSLIQDLIELDRGDMLPLIDLSFMSKGTLLALVKDVIENGADSALQFFTENKYYRLDELEKYLSQTPYSYAMEQDQYETGKLFPADSLWLSQLKRKPDSKYKGEKEPWEILKITCDYDLFKELFDNTELTDRELLHLLELVILRRDIEQTSLVLSRKPVLTDSTLWHQGRSPLAHAAHSDQRIIAGMVSAAMLNEHCTPGIIQEIFGIAVYHGNRSIAAKAVELGADVNAALPRLSASKESALVAGKESPEMIDYLLEQGVADPTPSELFRLITGNYVTLLDGIYKRGYDLNKPIERGLTLAFVPTGYKLYELMREHGADLSHRDEKGLTPLMYMVQRKMVSPVQWLLANGADPSMKFDEKSRESGETVLEYAIESRQAVTVGILLNYGAVGTASTDSSLYKRHPLVIADGMKNVGYGANRTMFDLLAEANLPYPTDPETLSDLLYRGMKNKNLTLVNRVIKDGGDVNQEYPNRRTVLEYACKESSVEVIKALIAAGAEIQTDRGRYQRDLLDLATSRAINYSTREEGREVVKYLLSIIPPEKYSLEASVDLAVLSIMVADTTLMKTLMTKTPGGFHPYIVRAFYDNLEWKESETAIRWIFNNRDLVPIWPNTLRQIFDKTKRFDLLKEFEADIIAAENKENL